MKVENKQLLVIAHLSQLLDFVTGFGGLIVPLVLWLAKRDSVIDMDEHGKSIVNFQISMILYALACIPLIILCGLGFLGIIGVALLCIIFPIVNAIKASNGEQPYYPLSIRFV